MNVKPAILLLVLAGLYLVAVNDHWAPKPDSALYMGLGRSLAEGRGMAFNGRQEWGIPPAAPFLIAACRYVAGPHDWPANLCMTLMGLGVVVFAWLGVRRLSADLPASARGAVEVGTLAAAGLSARLFIDSARILTDVPCAFFLMVAFWAVVRARSGRAAWYVAGAMAAALAVLARVPALVCAAGLLAAAAIDMGRRRRGRALVAWRSASRWRRAWWRGGRWRCGRGPRRRPSITWIPGISRASTWRNRRSGARLPRRWACCPGRSYRPSFTRSRRGRGCRWSASSRPGSGRPPG